jgi:hypothetical protein
MDALPDDILVEIAAYVGSLEPFIAFVGLISIDGLFEHARRMSLHVISEIRHAMNMTSDPLRYVDACFLLSKFEPRNNFMTRGWLPHCPDRVSFLTIAYRISLEMAEPTWSHEIAARVEDILVSANHDDVPNYGRLKMLFYETLSEDPVRVIHRDLVPAADRSMGAFLGMRAYSAESSEFNDIANQMKDAGIEKLLLAEWDKALPRSQGIARVEGAFAIPISLDAPDKTEFVTTPAHLAGGIGGVLQCGIRRFPIWRNGMYSYDYKAHVQIDSSTPQTQGVPVMTARKTGLTTLSVFVNTGSLNDEGKKVGEIQSNLQGTSYTFVKMGDDDGSENEVIGSADFLCKFLGGKPRVMSCMVSTGDDCEDSTSVESEDSVESTCECIQRWLRGGRVRASRHNRMLQLVNRKPWWNVNLGAFVLNFSGRVTRASVKNFQLIKAESDEVNEGNEEGADQPAPNQSDVLLQFGKVGNSDFTMDLRAPCSPLVGFCVAVAALDRKVACQL